MSRQGIFKILILMAFFSLCIASGFIIHLGVPAFSEDLLIITPREFTYVLEPLVEHKNNTSMPAMMIELESIYTDTRFNGADEPEEIKKAIEYYVRNNHIKYVMLVGDCNKFPLRWQFGHLFDGNGEFIHTPFHLYVPSDYYYADIYDGSGGFNDWDAEPDGYYGKIYITDINPDGIDLQPDVAVARVPAQNIRQLENYVTKVIRYEHKTFGKDWFRRVLLIQNSFTDDITTKEIIATHFNTIGYGVTRFYSNMDPNYYTGPSDGIPIAANITQQLNNGFGFISQTWHGWYGGWYDFGVEFGSPLETSNGDMMYDTNNLVMHDPNNAYRLPIIYSGACDTNKFAMTPPFIINYTTEDGWDFNRPISGAQLGIGPDPNKPEQFGIYPRPAPLQERYNNYSLGEAFLMESLDGAIAYYGNMETGEDVHRAMDESFFEAYNPATTNILGDMWQYAIERYVIENHVDSVSTDPNNIWPMIKMHGPSRTILFGDPSLRVGGIPFLRDLSPPVTRDDAPSLGWTNWNVVTLTTTDFGSPASGVRETMYRVDSNIAAGGPWQRGRHIEIGSDGIHQIEYYSEDFLENRENPPKLATFRLDKVPPVTEVLLDGNMPATVVGTPGPVIGCPWGGSFHGDVEVSFSATDDRSGVAATFYRLSGSSTFQLYSTPRTLRSHDFVTLETIRYRSTDNAGNQEAEKCIYVSVTGNGRLGEIREHVRILAALKEIISFRMRKELDLPFKASEMFIEYAVQPAQGEPNWQYLGTDYDLTDGGEVLWDTKKIANGDYLIKTTIWGVQARERSDKGQGQGSTIYQEQNRAQVCNIPASSYLFTLSAPHEAEQGQTIEYTLTFSNKLDNPIYNLYMTCYLDTGLFSKIDVIDNGQTDNNGLPSWYIKELKSGDTWKGHVVATINPNIAPNTLITSQAAITADSIPLLVSDDPATQEKGDYTATTIKPLQGKITGTIKEDTYGSPVQAVVTIAGPVSKNTTTNSNGGYSFSNLPQGAYKVGISVKGYVYSIPGGPQAVGLEGMGETGYAHFIVRPTDDTPPRSSISLFVNEIVKNNLVHISGAASDPAPGSGVKEVDLSIRCNNTNTYWDGQNWSKIKTWLPAQGTTQWTCPCTGISWNSKLFYTIESRATDKAGNVATPYTITSTPGIPTLISPANGSQSTDLTPAFDWSGTPNAHYILQLNDDGNFCSTEIETTLLLSDSLYTPKSPLAEGRYFWRAKAIYRENNDAESAWSDVWGFTIEPPLQDSDRDGITDDIDTDDDNDGLPDTYEEEKTKTSPIKKDSDGDGTLDGDEDPDNDGFTNYQEWKGGSDPLVQGSVPGDIKSFTITLSPGWNAVGLALENSSGFTAQGLCEEIASQGGAIIEADRLYQGAWEGHVCGLPFNTYAISPGQGVFVKMEATSTWTQSGLAIPSPLCLDLRTGWNFTALPLWAEGLFDAQGLIDEINAQGGCCTEIDRFSGGAWEGHFDGQAFNNFPIAPGEGHALRCGEPATVIINAPPMSAPTPAP